MAVVAASPFSAGQPPSSGRQRRVNSHGGHTAASSDDEREVAPSRAPLAAVLPGDEQRAVATILDLVGQAGVQASPLDVVTFFVALKTKPLVILVGPGGSGKVTLVRTGAKVLAGVGSPSYQEMVGHAWWSSGCTMLAQAQARFNVEKVLAFATETLLRRNSEWLRIACLARISSAELTMIFAELAPQIHRGWVRKLGGSFLSRRAAFPPNLTLVGTLDEPAVRGWDLDLFPQTCVVTWSPRPAPPVARGHTGDGTSPEGLPLHSLSVRTSQAACQKIRQIEGYRPQALKPLFELAQLLGDSRMPAPSRIIGEAVVFIANAWSFDGVGLFDRDGEDNLMLALDAALASSILPHVAPIVATLSIASRRSLRALLANFPRALTVAGPWL
ncbi:MAG: hypothetical protein WDA71_14780 [Actinomycetota bacterium]